MYGQADISTVGGGDVSSPASVSEGVDDTAASTARQTDRRATGLSEAIQRAILPNTHSKIHDKSNPTLNVPLAHSATALGS